MIAKEKTTAAVLISLAASLGTALITVYLSQVIFSDTRVFAAFLSCCFLAILLAIQKNRYRTLFVITLATTSMYADLPLWEEPIYYPGGAKPGFVFLSDVPLLMSLGYCRFFRNAARSYSVFSTRAGKLLIVLFTLECLSSINAPDRVFAGFQLIQSIRGLAYLYVIDCSVRNLEDVEQVGKIILFVVFMHSGIALAQFFHGGPLGLSVLGEGVKIEGIHFGGFSGEHIAKVSGLVGGPNTYSLFIEMLLPVVLSLFLVTQEASSVLFRFMVFCLGLVTGIAVFCKAGWILIPLSVVAACWYNSRIKHIGWRRRVRPWSKYGLVFLVCVAGFVLFSGAFVASIENPSRGLAFTIEKRLEHIMTGFEMIGRHPFLGCGLNNYALLYEGGNIIAEHAALHNYYLLICAECGVMSLVVFALLSVEVVKVGFRCVKCRHELVRRFAVGIMIGLAGLYLHNMVEWLLRTPTIYYLFLLQIGLLVCMERICGERRGELNPAL